MSIPNRELSQFASFLQINDLNQNISITTGTTPFVGIGTTAPQQKLDVRGNIKADAFYGDGQFLSNVTAVVTGSFVVAASGIHTSSNVGIGTTLFNQRLNVGGAVEATRFFSTIPTGTAPFSVQSTTVVPNLNATLLNGKVAPSGNIVGETDVQTLSNKTLTSPLISSIRSGQDGTAILSVPTTSGTIIHSNAVGIITSGLYGTGSITNTHVNNSAAISYSKLNLSNSIKSSDIDSNNKVQNDKLANSTISGVQLGQSLATLSPGSYITGSGYNGSTSRTFSVNASTDNIPNTIVARDANGNTKVGGIIPVGAIFYFPSTNAPIGFLKANGDSIPNGSGTVQGVTHDFSELYSIVGPFLPDLRGEFIRCWDDGRGIDPGRTNYSWQDGTWTRQAMNDYDDIDGGTPRTSAFVGQAYANADRLSTFPPSGSKTANKKEWLFAMSDNAISATPNYSAFDIPSDGGNWIRYRPSNISLLACIKY